MDLFTRWGPLKWEANYAFRVELFEKGGNFFWSEWFPREVSIYIKDQINKEIKKKIRLCSHRQISWSKTSFNSVIYYICMYMKHCLPLWLSLMHVWLVISRSWGFSPARSGKILSWRLFMKYFLRSFSPFSWFKKGSCQFLAKEYSQVLVKWAKRAQEKVWLGKLTVLDITLMD